MIFKCSIEYILWKSREASTRTVIAPRVIVAHFFWEVIVSDLAHEKSELVHLCQYH